MAMQISSAAERPAWMPSPAQQLAGQLVSLSGHMPIPNLLAMALGFFMSAIGILGFAAPSVLLELGRSLQSAGGLYVVAAVRIGFGTILFWAAPDSRTPRILRVLGMFIVIAGLVTPFIGVERSRVMFDWWWTQGPFFTRAWPLVAVGLGLFIAYSTSPRGSAA